MFKKLSFGRVTVVLATSLLLSPFLSFADDYFLLYPGNAFLPVSDTWKYYKSSNAGYLYDDTGETSYICSVNFRDEGLYVKKIHVRFRDSTNTGYMVVSLRRINIWNGTWEEVAKYVGSWYGTPGEVVRSFDAISGRRYINRGIWAYWLVVTFSGYPHDELRLISVRIKYGTY